MNCGASSCPPISAYTPDNVDLGLERAAISFINSSETILDINQKKIQLSSLFKWYKLDFCDKNTKDSLNLSEDQQMLKFVAKYLQPNESNDKNEFQKIIDENKMKISFASYNWMMNGIYV